LQTSLRFSNLARISHSSHACYRPSPYQTPCSTAQVTLTQQYRQLCNLLVTNFLPSVACCQVLPMHVLPLQRRTLTRKWFIIFVRFHSTWYCIYSSFSILFSHFKCRICVTQSAIFSQELDERNFRMLHHETQIIDFERKVASALENQRPHVQTNRHTTWSRSLINYTTTLSSSFHYKGLKWTHYCLKINSCNPQ
jgi:hypothetical protein